MTAKAHLLSACRTRGLPVVSSMGAAGKLDPSRVAITDLAATTVCPMAKALRRILRHEHGWPDDGPFAIRAVYSTEPRNWPRALTYDGGDGFRCVCPHKSNEHSCDSRSLIDGTVSFVTGTFGLFMASEVVNHIATPFMGQAPPGWDGFGERPPAEQA
jgi:tRNA A37 threonylcarbamoyladenosine dehydratase